MRLLQTYSGKDDWAFWIKEGDPVWYLQSSFEEKELAKSSGFSWHGKKGDDGKWTGKKVWFTGERDKAAKMADYADQLSDWGKDLMKRKVELTTSLSGSRQSVSYADIPKPEGLEYYPFQRAGVEYMMARQNTLLGDDMGLGKTIQVLGLINIDSTIKTVLVICPATLKLNWKREMERWFVRDMGKIGIADPKVTPLPENGYNIVITNYETVSKINKKLTELEWDLLVVDEAHMLKNQKTIRYMSVMGGKKNERRWDRILAKRKVFTTGTPVCNRPSELWPLISAVDPEHWNEKTFWYYHKRYCNAQRGRYGFDMKGAADETKLNELQIKLRETCLSYESCVITLFGVLPIWYIVDNRIEYPVLSYNTQEKKYEWKDVIGWKKSRRNKPLLCVKTPMGSVRNTTDHKLYRGGPWTEWINAEHIYGDLQMPMVWIRYGKEIDWWKKLQILFNKMFSFAQRKNRRVEKKINKNKEFKISGDSRRKELRLVQDPHEKGKFIQIMVTPEVLQCEVCGSMEGNTTIRFEGSGKSEGNTKKTVPSFRRNKNKDWKVETNGRPKEKNVGISEKKMGRFIERRYKNTQNKFGTNVVGESLESKIKLDRISNKTRINKWAIQAWEMVHFLGRYCFPGFKDSNRGGWENAPFEETDSTGQFQGKEINRNGVDSDKGMEQRSERIGGECYKEDQFVFDIEVEGNHNFVAENGLIYHNCLIRRLKGEVLTDLPPKMRQVIELEYDESDGDIRRCLQAEKEIEGRDNDSDEVIEKMAKVELAKVSENDDEYRAAISDLAEVSEVSFTETSRVRHDTAVAKLPYAIDFIKEQLESVPKLVVAAYHQDVIEGFAKAFPLESVSIYGEMNLDKRQQSIDRFQTDENCKVALLSMTLGVGITLTAASHIYFVEEDWVPATITQTEDRLHRIGQKDCVNVYHLVLANSMDVKMIKMVMEKQKIIEATLDKILESEPVVPTKQKAVSASLSRQKIAEEAETISDAEVEEIHDKLKRIAAMDRDHARMQNGVGFSRIDGYMGHQLAQTMFLSKKQCVIGRRIVKKYVHQLERLSTAEEW